MTGDPGLADLDQFMIKKKKKKKKKKSKTGNIEMVFFDGKHWLSLTNKRTGEFLVTKALIEKFGGLNVMKSVLSLDETLPALEKSFKTATKLKCELPKDIEMESITLEELLSIVEDIHVRHGRHHKILTLTCENF